MLPALAREGLVDAVDAFCETHRLLARADPARVRRRRIASGLRVKLHAEQLSNMQGAALAAPFSALSADHLEYVDEAGIEAMATRRHRRGAAARRVLFPARDAACRRSSLLRAHGVPMAHRHGLQSRHLAAHLAAAGDEHGRDAVPHDGRRMPDRRHARGRAGARDWRDARHARSLASNATSPSGMSSVPRSSSIAMGLNPLHARVWRGAVKRRAPRMAGGSSRRRAADRELSAHRHRDSRRTSKRSLVSPWLARKDADYWVDVLYDFAHEMGATTHAHGAVAHGRST